MRIEILEIGRKEPDFSEARLTWPSAIISHTLTWVVNWSFVAAFVQRPPAVRGPPCTTVTSSEGGKLRSMSPVKLESHLDVMTYGLRD